MPPRPGRRFTLIDAMILVAAAALGMAGIRAERSPHMHLSIVDEFISVDPQLTLSSEVTILNPRTTWAAPLFGWMSWVRGWADWISPLAAPCLAALSLAMLAIRLRQPRARWSLLVRQAGLVASLAATLAFAGRFGLALIQLLIGQLHDQLYQPAPPMSDARLPLSRLSGLACQTIPPPMIGLVVLVSWMALALGGRRRREDGWIDRAGIVVGLGWVTLLLLGH